PWRRTCAVRPRGGRLPANLSRQGSLLRLPADRVGRLHAEAEMERVATRRRLGALRVARIRKAEGADLDLVAFAQQVRLDAFSRDPGSARAPEIAQAIGGAGLLEDRCVPAPDAGVLELDVVRGIAADSDAAVHPLHPTLGA